MGIDWSAWSWPVAVWWGFLLAVSAGNIALFLLLVGRFGAQSCNRAQARSGGARWVALAPWGQPWVLLCAAYVFGCAFRAALPRADVQRICLFDTWLSTVVVGRSVATVAEICFALQWAIVLRQLGEMAGADTTLNAAWLVVPLILVAECFSWYAVLTTNYLGNAIENSIWAVAFLIVGVALC